MSCANSKSNSNSISSDSDSEADNAELQKFMEAADTTLLRNDMFRSEPTLPTSTPLQVKATIKSQRFLDEGEINNINDFNLPNDVQTHFYKKLTDIISKQIEFYNITPVERTDTKKIHKTKNRVQLLSDALCYIDPQKSNDDFQGPTKKPVIKRRVIVEEEDAMESIANKKKCLNSIAVSAEFIESQIELKYWAKKKNKRHKYFNYVKGKDGVLHFKSNQSE